MLGPFDCAAITISSGLGPEKGLEAAEELLAVYGRVKRFSEGWRGVWLMLLNIVLANAEGSACCGGSSGAGGGAGSGLFWTGGALGAFSCSFVSLRFRNGNPRDKDF